MCVKLKVLVTGGCGFIGYNLVERLIRENCEIYVVDNLVRGSKENIHPGVYYYFEDINEFLKRKWIYSHKIDIIYHLAGLARVQPSFEKPIDTMITNVIGTQAVLEIARQFDSLVIYAGSSSSITDPYISPYASSKKMGEDMCKTYHLSYGVNVITARFFNVFGNRQLLDPVMGNLMGIWQYQYLNKLPLTIIKDACVKRRSFTRVEDIVEGLIRMSCLPEEEFDGQYINLGRDVNYSVDEISKIFIKYADRRIEWDEIKPREGEPKESLADLTHTYELLNFKPTLDVESYIKQWFEDVHSGKITKVSQIARSVK